MQVFAGEATAEDWLSKNANFNFYACQDVYKKRNVNRAAGKDDASINQKAEACASESKRAFAQGFLRQGDSRISDRGMRNGISILSESDLQYVYDSFLKNPYFPYEVIETQHCFGRAEYMALYLRSRGISPGQVVADGDFNVPSIRYPDYKVHWTRHTAIFLLNERGERIVIDPSLSNSPLTMQQWTEILTKYSAKKEVDLRFIKPDLLHKGSQKEIENIEIISGIMMYDMAYLLDGSTSKPDRISYEILPTVAELTEFYSRKKIRIRAPIKEQNSYETAVSTAK